MEVFVVKFTIYSSALIDVPAKTATGTIALKVEDSNDQCPTLTSTYQQVCSDNKVVDVTAFDEDADPNGAPYEFVMVEEKSMGKWQMVTINGKDDFRTYNPRLDIIYVIIAIAVLRWI